ncbi:MAG: electron transfer flavoprotein subunit beta [Sulfobacillus acidophilus]|uniref:Electron transfer flavoprotein subunit beta n=1 Tax=Sulfobacillus acidophilus TaxID=53633 RepID=A0A2T2WG35_9FIRM|nr:MAG: electron transfer flavoprotein subunit beta [Sulfobacillus acidophilus]
MRIAVLMKDVPDLVEELEVEDGALPLDDMSFVPSEWDDQALEEALLIKEETGADVTVVAIDTGEVDGLMFTALAKGADRAVKLAGGFSRRLANRQRGAVLAQYCQTQGFDLVMTGVQAIDDLDGQIAGWVAGNLEVGHASVVRDVRAGADTVKVVQEYSGGKMAELELPLPAVLGIQAARKPPRYVTVAKVRQLQKTASVETVDVSEPTAPTLSVRKIYKPEAAGHAQMWGDDVDEVSEKIVNLLEDKKLLRS